MSPKEIFDNAEKNLDFLKAPNFEGQYYDRKEIRIETKTQKENIRDEILSCVSSFANSNQSGGLLVIGIDNSGKIKGVDHVDEGELNGILMEFYRF
jgi:hypothetical protein